MEILKASSDGILINAQSTNDIVDEMELDNTLCEAAQDLAKTREIEDDQLPEHRDSGSDEDNVLDQLPDALEDSLSNIDHILEDCRDLSVLKNYVAYFEKRYKENGKTDDLNLEVRALQAILRQRGLSEADEDHYDTLLFDALAEQCSAQNLSGDKSDLQPENRKRKLDDDPFVRGTQKRECQLPEDHHPASSDEVGILEHLPEVSENTLPDIDLILEGCEDLSVLKHYAATFEVRFKQSRKMEDLDRNICALRGILQLTAEHGITEAEKNRYEVLLNDSLRERDPPSDCEDVEVIERKEDNDGRSAKRIKIVVSGEGFSLMDKLPEIIKTALSDVEMDSGCSDALPDLKRLMASFEEHSKDGVKMLEFALQRISSGRDFTNIGDASDALFKEHYPLNPAEVNGTLDNLKLKNCRSLGQSSSAHDKTNVLDPFLEVTEESLPEIGLILEDCQDFFVLGHYVTAFGVHFERFGRTDYLDRQIQVLERIIQTFSDGLTQIGKQYFDLLLLKALLQRYHTTDCLDDGDKFVVVARRIMDQSHDFTKDLVELVLLRVLVNQVHLFDEEIHQGTVTTNSLVEFGRRMRREADCHEQVLDIFMPLVQKGCSLPSALMLKLSWCWSLLAVLNDDEDMLNRAKHSFEELWTQWNAKEPSGLPVTPLTSMMVYTTNLAIYLSTKETEYLERLGAQKTEASEFMTAATGTNHKAAVGKFLMKNIRLDGRSTKSVKTGCIRIPKRLFETLFSTTPSSTGDDSTQTSTAPLSAPKDALITYNSRQTSTPPSSAPKDALITYNSRYLHSQSSDDAEQCKKYALSVLQSLEQQQEEGEHRVGTLEVVVQGLFNHFHWDCLRNAQSLRTAAKLVFGEELMNGTRQNWERLGQLGVACTKLFRSTRYMPTINFGISYLRMSVEGLQTAARDIHSKRCVMVCASNLVEALFERQYHLTTAESGSLDIGNLMPAVMAGDYFTLASTREVDIFQTSHHDPNTQSSGANIELRLALGFFNKEGGPKYGEDAEWYRLTKAIVDSSRDPSHGLFSSVTRLSALLRYAEFCFYSIIGETPSPNLEVPYAVFGEAISVLQRVIIAQPATRLQRNIIRDRDNYMSDFVSIPSRAAHYSIEVNEIEHAVEFLEYGRLLLWSRTRGLRAMRGELDGLSEDLGNRFAFLCQELEEFATLDARLHPVKATSDDLQSTNDSIESAMDQDQPDEIHEKKERLDAEFELVVEEIRQTPGNEEFLQLTPFHKLQSAACEGPVIILAKRPNDVIKRNVGFAYAIIVLDSQEPVIVTLDKGVDSENTLTDISHRLQDIRRNPSKTSETLTAVLKDIGEHIVKEIVATLLSLGVLEQSRIWWCPTSIFSDFPVHAAMWQDQTEGGESKFTCLSDIYVSSYTSSLTSLIHARSQDIGYATVVQKLSVSSRTPMLVVQQDRQLKWASQEVENIKYVAWKAGHTPNTFHLCDSDDHAEDGREKVLGLLPQSRWTHIACHGISDAAEPFASHFQVGGGRITLLDILKSKIPNAELAYLSACQNADPPKGTSQDEPLHLAAAMQFCGFRSVVGTMWPSNAEDGPQVTKEFYEYMFAEPEDGEEVGYKRSARALHRVTQRMRYFAKQNPERWVNFVHIGA